MRAGLIALGTLLVAGGYGWVLWSASWMEDTESDLAGHPQPLGDLETIAQGQLVTASVHEGQDLLFEVCSADGFAHDAWREVSFDIWFVPADEKITAKSIAELEDRISRNAHGAGCVVVSHRENFGVSGEVAIGLSTLPPAIAEVDVQGHIVAWTPVTSAAYGSLWAILLGALLLTAGLSWPPKPSAFPPPERSLGWIPRAGVGLGLLALTMVVLSFLPGGSAAGGVVRGLVIAAVELAVAFRLTEAVRERDEEHAHRRHGLALRRPAWLWFALMPVAGVAISMVGMMVARMIPSTGVAPIETFVAAPSGALAVASISVFVPFAEELFFRGFLYGTIERAKGANVATLLAVVLFAVVHLPQQWGAWGSFVSVTLAGALFTLLRRASGSTVLPIVAHLAHNALISLLAVR
ncbi:MAG: type II CAAX endopeptidase family protein [Myxococcota bacterium]